MNLRLAVLKISCGGRPWNGGPVTVVVKTLLTPTFFVVMSVSTSGPLPAPAGAGKGGRASVVSVTAVVPTTSAPMVMAMRTGAGYFTQPETSGKRPPPNCRVIPDTASSVWGAATRTKTHWSAAGHAT